MKIYKKTYDEIIQNIKDTPPESGGIIGCHKDSKIVSKMFFDRGLASKKMCAYTPNIEVLNDIIFKWHKDEIQFLGIYHTHYANVETLSSADRSYIKSIIESMPKEIKFLYFPLILMPDNKIVSYKAFLKDGKLEIKKEVVKVV